MNRNDKISRIKIALDRDNAKFIDIDDNKPLRKTMVTFTCKCGNEHKKGFLTLEKYDNSALCKKCTNAQMNNKIIETNKALHGYEHAVMAPENREKSIKTIQSKEYREKISKIMKNKFSNGEIKAHVQTDEIKEKIKKTLLDKTGYENPMQNPETKEKRNQANLEKYGTICPVTVPEIKAKALATMEQKTGKKYALQTEESKTKQVQTMINKYGVEYAPQSPEFIEKAKATCLENHGVENYFKHPDFINKAKETWIKNYGTSNPMQNSEIMEKNIASNFKRKEYITPNGNTLICQGYEPYALDELLKEKKIDENDIINGTSKVPRIDYIGSNGKDRKHFVDIYLPKQNKCIEVKSTYLFAKDKENILGKQKAGKKAGYKYEIWVYDTRNIDKEKYKLNDIKDIKESKKGKMYKIVII